MTTIEALRTPDDRFAGLPDYPFAPNYIEDLPGYGGLRMHYLDEGRRDPGAPVFLCLHGQPTWSYLYRKMIPIFAPAGRVVAPDMFGFGRSDKPVDDAWYTFETHRNALLAFITAMDLRNVVLVCQDWGGILGLTLPMEMPDRFTRLLVMNTSIGTGERDLGEGFKAWRAYNRSQPDLAIGRLMKRGKPDMTDAEAAAYDAPYPDPRYKGGVRRFPELVPDGIDAPGAAISRKARDFWRDTWTGDSFMAIGMRDPVLGEPVMRALQRRIRNCPEPMEIAEAGHFVQEWGEPIARAALDRFGLS